MTDLTDPSAEGWRRPRPGASAYRADAWIAVVLAAGTALSISLSRGAGIYSDSPVWLAALWVAGITLPLAARRRWPEAVAVFVSVVFAGGAMLGAVDLLFSNICLYVAIFTVGAWGQNRMLARWLRLFIVVAMFVWLFWALITQANQATTMPGLSRDGAFSPYAAWGLLQVLINLLYFGAAYYFGDTAWQSARRSAVLEERTQELARERQHSAAQAVALERVRIARELHDVVAHHVSVMGVQAGAARRILDRDPAAAAQALSQIEQSARSAVDELGALLTALRADDADDAADATDVAPGVTQGLAFGPTPASLSSSTRGVAQLEELAEQSRAAGIPVQFGIVGDPRTLPGTISLNIYRIAQEALTNTRKHAGSGVSVDLRLRYETDAVELEVTDDGVGRLPASRTGVAARVASGAAAGVAAGVTSGVATGAAAGSTRGPAASGGHGHLGMRERVAAGGGTLELGARPRGGYRVRARFPLAPPHSPTHPAELEN
ncbi:sensor histidine kinase [Leifsonia kafniensis]|uniref:histidine kinase n=1 Tax=Leifsonia kafniensis TaxID=475957 RepID=A0ABP7KGK8_9MICO